MAFHFEFVGLEASCVLLVQPVNKALYVP